MSIAINITTFVVSEKVNKIPESGSQADEGWWAVDEQ